MKASVLDLRRRMREVLAALDRNEPVTILYRGRKKGVLYPARSVGGKRRSITGHPACGMWKDRTDLKDAKAFVRRARKGRFNAL